MHTLDRVLNVSIIVKYNARFALLHRKILDLFLRPIYWGTQLWPAPRLTPKEAG